MRYGYFSESYFTRMRFDVFLLYEMSLFFTWWDSLAFNRMRLCTNLHDEICLNFKWWVLTFFHVMRFDWNWRDGIWLFFTWWDLTEYDVMRFDLIPCDEIWLFITWWDLTFFTWWDLTFFRWWDLTIFHVMRFGLIFGLWKTSLCKIDYMTSKTFKSHDRSFLSFTCIIIYVTDARFPRWIRFWWKKIIIIKKKKSNHWSFLRRTFWTKNAMKHGKVHKTQGSLTDIIK